MKNVLIFLRFAGTSFVICLLYDLISNKKFAVYKYQLLSSVIIAVLLGVLFTVFFFSKTYVLSVQSVDLEKLKKELIKYGFRLIEENTSCLRFRGNISYYFYVGDIKLHFSKNEIVMQGTRFVLGKMVRNT